MLHIIIYLGAEHFVQLMFSYWSKKKGTLSTLHQIYHIILP